MRQLIFAVFGIFAFTAAAVAGDPLSTGDSYGPRQPNTYTSDAYTGASENQRAERQSYDQLVEDGGCNAEVVPFAYAVDCSHFLVNHAPFGGEQNGQFGSTGD